MYQQCGQYTLLLYISRTDLKKKLLIYKKKKIRALTKITMRGADNNNHCPSYMFVYTNRVECKSFICLLYINTYNNILHYILHCIPEGRKVLRKHFIFVYIFFFYIKWVRRCVMVSIEDPQQKINNISSSSSSSRHAKFS